MTKTHQSKILSVIVPTFNQGEYLARCLRSLINQTMSSDLYEIIVINDGSTDQTMTILEVFGNRVTVIDNEKNAGLPASLNAGISLSSAEFLVRVDSDDFVTSKFLDFLYGYMEHNPSCAAVACDYLLLDDYENVLATVDSSLNPIGCGILFKKSLVLDVGGYDEHFRLNEEKEFRIRFEAKHRIEHLQIPLYRYRRHGSNITNDTVTMEKYYNDMLTKHSIKQ